MERTSESCAILSVSFTATTVILFPTLIDDTSETLSEEEDKSTTEDDQMTSGQLFVALPLGEIKRRGDREK